MAEPNYPSARHSNSKNTTGTTPGRAPRWVKAFGNMAILLVLLFSVLHLKHLKHLIGGVFGGHSPSASATSYEQRP
jgi:hypothetical protein